MSIFAPEVRKRLVEAAAEHYAGAELPFWSNDMFLEGQITLIVDATGFNSKPVARSEVWDEVAAEHSRVKLVERAEEYARTQITEDDALLDLDGIRLEVKLAYLAGYSAAKAGS